MLWRLAFWKGAGERAIKTFAHAALAIAAVGYVTVAQVPWLTVLGAGLLAAALSVLTSIGNADFTAGTPSVDSTSPTSLGAGQ